MKQIITLLILSISLLANGVAVQNSNGTYLKLTDSFIEVSVENQVAVVKTTQYFKNNLGFDAKIKYAFPLNSEASAINLKWKVNGIWKQAGIAPTPQDSTLPGGGEMNANLKEFLGESPLFAPIADTIKTDSTIIIELTYVQLLNYKFGKVNFSYPNDYTLIQNDFLDSQELQFNLLSSRTIESIDFSSHSNATINLDQFSAQISYSLYESAANQDYELYYVLSLDELGLFGFSTFLPDSIVPDKAQNGFFTFVAEPDPSEGTDVIQKVFTLIIDRSGSMSGAKIIQAKNAAKFIVENLNEGDYFNIVDFESNVYSFRSTHVEFNEANKQAALNYVNNIYDGGGTNIAGAFQTSINQFNVTSNQTANIIIFFTDGEATVGETSTQGILNIVSNLIDQKELKLSIFTFGIGDYVNTQLLTLLATQNNGISMFLGNDLLEEVITDFYLQIRNPVLLDTEISFEPDIISEVYPEPLPNLYKGQQMILSGRYSTAGIVNVKLSGNAFGSPVEYNYSINLADTANTEYQFLTKVWAKSKIENLLLLYFSLDPETTQAKEIKDQIIYLSQTFGVITQFTSFTGIITSVEEQIEVENEAIIAKDFQLLGNYPNPFNPSTIIRVAIGRDFFEDVKIRIYNSLGELIREMILSVNGKGIYEIRWDGTNNAGVQAPSDVYIYVVDFGNTILSNKMILLK